MLCCVVGDAPRTTGGRTRFCALRRICAMMFLVALVFTLALVRGLGFAFASIFFVLLSPPILTSISFAKRKALSTPTTPSIPFLVPRTSRFSVEQPVSTKLPRRFRAGILFLHLFRCQHDSKSHIHVRLRVGGTRSSSPCVTTGKQSMGTENRKRDSSGVLVDDAMGSSRGVAQEERVWNVANMDSLLCALGRISRLC